MIQLESSVTALARENKSLADTNRQQKFEIQALKDFDSQTKSQILPEELAKGNPEEMLLFKQQMVKMRKLVMLIFFFFLVSMCMVGSAAIATSWQMGALYKPKNHNPNAIDDLPFIMDSFVDNNGKILGFFERGLFNRCENYWDLNHNSTNYYMKVQVQKRTFACNSKGYESEFDRLESYSPKNIGKDLHLWYSAYADLYARNTLYVRPNNTSY